ncbi:hypothetical protein F0562_035642 [Nyssa sinensis]|uniref:Uncharacterized protein n=1 Tax=Nyssa sinensis TaxID=561372 RepID=A0A5J5AFS0_9ASTE|nr:hypothetical protein F0562_035642 [Nyssa sinensis]
MKSPPNSIHQSFSFLYCNFVVTSESYGDHLNRDTDNHRKFLCGLNKVYCRERRILTGSLSIQQILASADGYAEKFLVKLQERNYSSYHSGRPSSQILSLPELGSVIGLAPAH